MWRNSDRPRYSTDNLPFVVMACAHGYIAVAPGVHACGPNFWEQVILTFLSRDAEDFDQDFVALVVDGHSLYARTEHYHKGTDLAIRCGIPKDPGGSDCVLLVMLREEY